MNEIIRAENISKDYFDGQQNRRVLFNINLSIAPNESVMIMGPSGSGKTTLLSILGLILTPSEGSVYIKGQEVKGLTEDEQTTKRLHDIGFVFQNSTLVPALNIIENLLLPCGIQGKKVSQEEKDRAYYYLERFKLKSHSKSFPYELSGGEKQRIAIIRALMNEPPILLCDEPTSVLDLENAKLVFHTLQDLSKEKNRSVLMITHDHRAINFASRALYLDEGHLKEKNDSH
jgi:ABC-type lipoprotein export system ATPase subunit